MYFLRDACFPPLQKKNSGCACVRDFRFVNLSRTLANLMSFFVFLIYDINARILIPNIPRHSYVDSQSYMSHGGSVIVQVCGCSVPCMDTNFHSQNVKTGSGFTHHPIQGMRLPVSWLRRKPRSSITLYAVSSAKTECVKLYFQAFQLMTNVIHPVLFLFLLVLIMKNVYG
jgi:hypothetical protein